MPGYEVKQERIAIPGVDDLVIRSLLDKHQFSDPQGDAERLGISSSLWPLFGLIRQTTVNQGTQPFRHPFV